LIIVFFVELINGEMIVALDSCGYKIKEISNSINIYTNYKTLKDFTVRLQKNEYIDCAKCIS
jgi:hypothetical protein